MSIAFPSRPLLALPLVAPLIGCAAEPAGQPIVLRPPHAGNPSPHRTVRRPRPEPSTAAQTSPAPASDPATERRPAADPEELNSAQKESLFKDFDAYLARSGRH